MKTLFKIFFLVMLITKCSTTLSMDKTYQSIWTPKAVIGTVMTFGFIKLGYDGLQKMFNANKNSSPILHSTVSGQGSKTINIQLPNLSNQIPQKITFKHKRLSQKEATQEFYQGTILLGIGALGTCAGLYCLNHNH